MKLYVMRHGPAEDHAPGGRDEDRALTPAGRERVVAVAEKLFEIGEAPRSIITSPLVRAVQTAEIVAIATLSKHGGGVEVRREMAPGGDVLSLARKLTAAGRKRVMLVGHEPDLSTALRGLLGHFDHDFAKAMVAGVHVAAHAHPARLRFVLEPRALELLELDRGARDGD
ncbi:MAG TPA: phosphohistidine phosphatase SixA [Polyangiaceae bacterium]|nr:phosphohistidine phosphatase SixA [Polyangiaceae bacterium]